MQSKKKTLVLGASIIDTRYSNICIRNLVEHEFPVEALGLRDGTVAGIKIQKGTPELDGIHTVTLYLGAHNQLPYYQYILDLKPARVIFNPGTENPEFEELLANSGIEVASACSIMMLHAGVYFEK
jgi:uncharacterized protein